MQPSHPMEILKEAILLERRGQAFYRQVSATATSQAVKDFFQSMADEETHHITILESQFRSFDQTGAFGPVDGATGDQISLEDRVLTPEIKDQIAGAGYEAAAISAAILMEENAVALYSQRADTAQDANERSLYQWLVDWEQGHLRFLVQLDQEIRQGLWQDNGFWPF